MARSTRLYQRARSPLIQGRSRRERPWQVDVAASAAWGLAMLLALTFGGRYAETGSFVGAVAAVGAWWSTLAAGAAVGAGAAAAGVSVARWWGAERPARIGALVSCAVVVVYWVVFGGVAAARR